jgi:hypothetical protein
MLDLASLKAEADDAVIRAEMAQTYADGARARLSSNRSRLERALRAAGERRAASRVRPLPARSPSGEGIAPAARTLG